VVRSPDEDKPADLTLTLTIDDLKAISQGKLAPMTAMMSGRLSISDMGVAADLQGKMQALFSKMQAASTLDRSRHGRWTRPSARR
jgi:putative sterol carrier protein